MLEIVLLGCFSRTSSCWPCTTSAPSLPRWLSSSCGSWEGRGPGIWSRAVRWAGIGWEGWRSCWSLSGLTGRGRHLVLLGPGGVVLLLERLVRLGRLLFLPGQSDYSTVSVHPAFSHLISTSNYISFSEL